MKRRREKIEAAAAGGSMPLAHKREVNAVTTAETAAGATPLVVSREGGGGRPNGDDDAITDAEGKAEDSPAADASFSPDAAHAGDGSDIAASATDTDRGVMTDPFELTAEAAAAAAKHVARAAHASAAAAAAATARPSWAAAANSLAHLNAYPPNGLTGKFDGAVVKLEDEGLIAATKSSRDAAADAEDTAAVSPPPAADSAAARAARARARRNASLPRGYRGASASTTSRAAAVAVAVTVAAEAEAEADEGDSSPSPSPLTRLLTRKAASNLRAVAEASRCATAEAASKGR